MVSRWSLVATVAVLLAACAGPANSDAPPVPQNCDGFVVPANPALHDLTIDTAKGVVAVKVELADTEPLRNLGLMCRPSIAADRGMMFDFSPPRAVTFWMHNTLISLDMVFIAPDGRILSIAHDVTPMSDELTASNGVIRGVLELGAGRAAALGLAPGDRVHFSTLPGGAPK
ncbi:uncharacterized membrane protein (UPF0127 family) [Caulobacter ginsengisoli]|uniref:Uncharacterized membrane protein (UPF0127 family) n=1 Tax=Caulobacter ginsengisoli TaxID=400775 RepID=A0ABU0IMF1_9CAUL|nr:DUF192 domain-containing protein [Caulobacter ginsengisoli]MDQ0463193.1 uncharacterized membrane protein (UPF0127 family) [Caulobacter ginsengisoli]